MRVKNVLLWVLSKVIFWLKRSFCNRALLRFFMHMKTHFSTISFYLNLQINNFFKMTRLIIYIYSVHIPLSTYDSNMWQVLHLLKYGCPPERTSLSPDIMPGRILFLGAYLDPNFFREDSFFYNLCLKLFSLIVYFLSVLSITDITFACTCLKKGLFSGKCLGSSYLKPCRFVNETVIVWCV